MWGWNKKNNSQKVEDSNSFIESIRKDRKDIKDIESKYQEFIIQSLYFDFDKFVNDLKENGLNSNTFDFWKINSIGWTSFKMYKKNSKIDIEYSFNEDSLEFEIKNIQIQLSSGKTTHLKSSLFKEIILKYFLQVQSIEIAKVKDKSLSEFKELVNIIGKDVSRDNMIDNILNG
jgi:hypothetical protein